jgi:hypothetical protein
MATKQSAGELLAELSKIDSWKFQDDPSNRKEALALARKVTLALESPIDRVLDYMFKVRRPANVISTT